ncbi:hypothetical protein Poly59_23080 [Rubripirellula reticaptiva]|uniref:Uncharacterized protein n=1 Tax=Rubripirellula reticaptiva TaxID=2528013 RepID=A0A5C6F486_9BACT|nr:hypothetical protein Poly59_23080 [Rubripirellula reticaptiva]
MISLERFLWFPDHRCLFTFRVVAQPYKYAYKRNMCCGSSRMIQPEKFERTAAIVHVLKT